MGIQNNDHKSLRFTQVKWKFTKELDPMELLFIIRIKQEKDMFKTTERLQIVVSKKR